MIDSRQIFAACSIAIAFCYFFICPGNYAWIGSFLDGILYGDLRKNAIAIDQTCDEIF